MTIPVITIDGPSASGKGTVAAQIASRLAFHYLDSGSLYRVVALLAHQQRVALDDELSLAELARDLAVTFEHNQVMLNGCDISEAIRAEAVGEAASRISTLPAVRAALLARQRAFRLAPGLVTDGRDMGSVVFPEATVKVFLTASADVRAHRRYKQLIDKGEAANMQRIKQGIIERDERDATRLLAPLRQQADALLLDSTLMAINEVVDQIIVWFNERQASAS